MNSWTNLLVERVDAFVERVNVGLLVAAELCEELGAELGLEHLALGLELRYVAEQAVFAALLARLLAFVALDLGLARAQVDAHLLECVAVAFAARLVLLQLVEDAVELRVQIAYIRLHGRYLAFLFTYGAIDLALLSIQGQLGLARVHIAAGESALARHQLAVEQHAVHARLLRELGGELAGAAQEHAFENVAHGLLHLGRVGELADERDGVVALRVDDVAAVLAAQHVERQIVDLAVHLVLIHEAEEAHGVRVRLDDVIEEAAGHARLHRRVQRLVALDVVDEQAVIGRAQVRIARVVRTLAQQLANRLYALSSKIQIRLTKLHTNFNTICLTFNIVNFRSFWRKIDNRKVWFIDRVF